MAHMIPPTPKDFDIRSREGDVFNSLKKLPDDYYVFHSVAPVGVNCKNEFYEREIDFVIANHKKGILCIEVKAGNNITYSDRTWRYSSGIVMKHNGPYHQVAGAKRALISKVRDSKNAEVQKLYRKCKFMHAVWFVEMTRSQVENLVGLPEEADMKITMCAEDLINPTRKIADIFAVPIVVNNKAVEQSTTDEEFQVLLDDVLCPHFRIIPSPQAKTIAISEHMNQLLREQYMILDFLEEQDSAVINGAAGTGKTMLAVEKARRHSMNGEKVLFLCYNRMLCEKLIEENKNNSVKAFRKRFENVDFMTISKLALNKTGRFDDYEGLLDWLFACIEHRQELGYQHIIVDEGQDFGLIDAVMDNESATADDNVSIIDALQEAAHENNGTFYLFYDKYQMIQGGGSNKYLLPDCIENSDCRLTLHTNCRNTQEIARTSFTPLRDKKNKMIKANVTCSWNEPIKPILHIITADMVKSLNKVIDELEQMEMNDVVILTTGDIRYSCVSDNLITHDDEATGYKYYQYKGKEFRVTTCIKFKGLEADAIIMIDLNKDSFIDKKGLEFYVGASRAKHRLDMICELHEEDYSELAHSLDPSAPDRNDPLRMRKIISSIFASDIEID